MQLKVNKYQSGENRTSTKKHYGLIADEVEKVFPEIVSHTNMGGKDYQSVNKSAYGIIAIKAIQEQQVIIESQKTDIQNQKADIEEMKTMINALKARIDQLSTGTSLNSKASSQNNQVMELSGARLMQNAPNLLIQLLLSAITCQK
jgi:hypothetical protein